MDTNLAHDEHSTHTGRNIVRDIVLALVVALLPGVVLFVGGWPLALVFLLYLIVANTERFRFNLHAKHGWLIAGAVCGACIGGIPPAIGNSQYQTLDSAISTIEGAILGTVIGLVIDLAKSLRRGDLRIQFRPWHIFAYLAICVLSAFIAWAFLGLLRVGSML